jgi:threonine synthase
MSSQASRLRINPNISRLVCSLSGKGVDAEGFRRPIGLCSCCPAPGKPIVVEYDLDAVRLRLEAAPADDGLGLLRYGPLLPVENMPPSFAADVGGTPIVRHEALSQEVGVELFLKDEGANPSGSFKDRGLAVGVAFGVACGAKRFCLPTQGNAGVAASLFSARLGLPGCLVYMPEGYEGGIYHRETELFGGEVRFAGPNIAASGRFMREAFSAELASGEFVDMSTFFEPGRLEGKKTMGFEIVEAFGADRLPDWILYPTGGGTGLVGIWKAFRELAGLGRLDPQRHRLPRMVTVQSENCPPVVRSFEAGLDHVEPVESRGTVADGLDVPGAIMGHGILRAIRESNGSAVAVPEEAIFEAFRDCGRNGIAVGYESAATLAGLRRLLAEGAIAPGDRVLLLLTASHLIPLAQAAIAGIE